MRIIIQRFHALLPALLAAAILASCNDTPTTIGSDYLPENVVFGSYTLKPEDYVIESGIAAVSNSSGRNGLGVGVGRAADGTVAHGLLALTSESPVVSGPGGRALTNASLILYPLPYRYGDTTSNQISFDVVVLDNAEMANLDTKWNDALVGSIESGTVLGTFTGVYPNVSSQAVTVPLDAAAAQTFMRDYFRYDSIAGGRQFRTLKSLALRARSGNSIIGTFFGVLGVSDSLRPKLRLETADTTVQLTIGTTNWIANSTVETGQGKLVVMGGVPMRTSIKLKLDSIPTGATIHQADLRLFIDEQNTKHGTFGEPNYMVAYIGTDTTFMQGSYLTSNLSGVLPVPRLALNEETFSNTFRFTSLGPTIGAWLRNSRGDGGLKNQGVVLAFYRGTQRPDIETTTVDRVVFHGPGAADPAVRPELKIIYSVQVDANK